MFFSYVARDISIMAISVSLLAVGAVKQIEPIADYTTLQNTAIEIQESIQKNQEWKLEIPKISLIANISEGTDEEVMNEYIGHFTETEEIKGNVGLAAHNRGYPVNYFKNLNKLEIGDKVCYTYLGNTKWYKVDKIKVIKDTNWEPLKSTKENRLTMITCIANKPEYRLCVQAIEIGGIYE